MKNFYCVIERIGDYPLEGQKYSGMTFNSFPEAFTAAEEVWKKSNSYAGLLEPDYYVLIEVYEEDSDIGIPRMALTSEGTIGAPGTANLTTNGRLVKFLAKYEV